MQQTLEMKSNALEATRLRVTELENTLAKRDSNFSEQKRLLKIVKEKYQVQLDVSWMNCFFLVSQNYLLQFVKYLNKKGSFILNRLFCF